MNLKNLSGKDLSGKDLRGVDFSGKDLSGRNLIWADLRGADLSGANLSWANLEGANLEEANLEGANLTEADLSEADLELVNLNGANLEGTNLPKTKSPKSSKQKEEIKTESWDGIMDACLDPLAHHPEMASDPTYRIKTKTEKEEAKQDEWNEWDEFGIIRQEEVGDDQEQNTETVLERLLTRFEDGLPMRKQIVLKSNPGLYDDCVCCYGSYRDALKSLGIDPEVY